MGKARLGLARMQVALIVLVLVAAAVIGAYALTNQGGNVSSSSVNLTIKETDPVNQIDTLIPQNITVKQGAPVMLAVQNGDDEVRVFTIAALNVNFTIDAGTTQRYTFTPGTTGTFVMHSPQTVPSAASKGKPGSPVTGYITVTP